MPTRCRDTHYGYPARLAKRTAPDSDVWARILHGGFDLASTFARRVRRPAGSAGVVHQRLQRGCFFVQHRLDVFAFDDDSVEGVAEDFIDLTAAVAQTHWQQRRKRVFGRRLRLYSFCRDRDARRQRRHVNAFDDREEAELLDYRALNFGAEYEANQVFSRFRIVRCEGDGEASDHRHEAATSRTSRSREGHEILWLLGERGQQARGVVERLEDEAKALWKEDRRGKPRARELTDEQRGLKKLRAEAADRDRSIREMNRTIEEKEARLQEVKEALIQLEAQQRRANKIQPVQQRLGQIRAKEALAGDLSDLQGLPADPTDWLEERERELVALRDDVLRLEQRLVSLKRVQEEVTEADRRLLVHEGALQDLLSERVPYLDRMNRRQEREQEVDAG